MSLISFAKEELERIGYNPNPDPNSEDIDDCAVTCILELLETFVKQEHSNFSDEIIYQNKRHFNVFKTINVKTKEEKCHLNDHYVFVDKNGASFTDCKSRLVIDEFPFSIPDKIYIHEGAEEAKEWIEKHQYDPFE